MKKALLTVGLVLVFYSNSFAQVRSDEDEHLWHGFFEPGIGLNLLGTAYNPATENWGWHLGTKVLFLHPTRSVWLGGIGFGIAFDQSASINRGPVFTATFVPLEIDGFSLEVSLNRVKSRDNYGNLTKSRLVVLAWNW